jgi:hypothetical protein
MDIAKTYWLLNNNVNQPKADYYRDSDKTPYERGMEALDYYRFYGGKPLNIQKTYLNRLIMPIYEDLDLFQLRTIKVLLKIKEIQDNFNADESIKDLLNLEKVVSTSIKENIKNKKVFYKDILSEFKETKKETNKILKEGVKNRKILLPFVNFMEHRELDDQELMNKIRLKFKNNSERIRKFKDNMLVAENLKEKRENEREVEKFNDYLVEFQKNLESKGRRTKIERLKMKINDIQMNLENEMLKRNEIPKINRNVKYYEYYRYNKNKDIDNKNSEKVNITENKSKLSKKTKKTKSEKSKSNKESKTESISSFSKFLQSKNGDEK